MTDPGPGGREPAAAPWWSGRRLAVHIAGLSVLLLATGAVADLGTAWISDEGRYALQAEALREQGGWEWQPEERGAEVDVVGAQDIFGPGATKRLVPYADHPLWAVLLSWSTAALGVAVGLHVLSALGAVLTASVAWFLTGRLGGPPWAGFWMAGLSPVFVNGHLAWAHAPSAALAGLAVLLALRLLGDGARLPATAGLAATVAVGGLLRSESLLWVAALSLAALVWAGLRRTWSRGLLVAGVAGGAALGTELVERAWTRSITTGASNDLSSRAAGGGLADFIDGRLGGARQVLLEGGDALSGGLMLSLLSLALVGAAVALILRGDRAHRAPVALAAAAAVYLVRAAVEPANTVSGLLAAWPVAVAGILVLLWRRPDEEMALVIAAGALFLGAVLLAQYEEGGSYEWGGRFLSPLTVPMAALAAAGFARVRRDLSAPGRAALMLLAAAPVLAGVANLAAVRGEVSDVERAVLGQPAQVLVTDNDSLPYRLWPTLHQRTWVVVRPSRLHSTTARLAAEGTVAVVTAEENLEGRGRLLPQGLALDVVTNTRSPGDR